MWLERVFRTDPINGRYFSFHCLLCDCWIDSATPFESHRNGKKHVKKLMQKTNDVYGVEPAPVTRPAVRAPEKGAATADRDALLKPLAEHLRAVGDAVLGLEFGELEFSF